MVISWLFKTRSDRLYVEGYLERFRSCTLTCQFIPMDSEQADPTIRLKKRRRTNKIKSLREDDDRAADTAILDKVTVQTPSGSTVHTKVLRGGSSGAAAKNSDTRTRTRTRTRQCDRRLE